MTSNTFLNAIPTDFIDQQIVRIRKLVAYGRTLASVSNEVGVPLVTVHILCRDLVAVPRS